MQSTTQWKTNTIVHTEFASADPQATQDFLERTFDWRFQDVEGEPYALVDDAEGHAIGGLRPVSEGEPGPNVMDYIGVADLEATAQAIEEHGGTVVVPIQEVADLGRMLWFQTPGGCVLACWEPRQHP